MYKVIKDINYKPGISRIAKFISKSNLDNFNEGKEIEIKSKDIYEQLKKLKWIKDSRSTEGGER